MAAALPPRAPGCAWVWYRLWGFDLAGAFGVFLAGLLLRVEGGGGLEVGGVRSAGGVSTPKVSLLDIRAQLSAQSMKGSIPRVNGS